MSQSATSEFCFLRALPGETAFSSPPQRSVNPGDDSVRNPLAVLDPQRSILRRAALVVGDLAREEQRHVVERVEPGKDAPGAAEREAEAEGHEDLAEVVGVAREPPEAAHQELLAAAADRLRGEDAKELGLGAGLEEELLQIGAAREPPAGEEQERTANEEGAGVWGFGSSASAQRPTQ